MPDKGTPLGAPLDRPLRLAACLPLPEGTSERDRDILWAMIARHQLGRSMPEIGAELGVSHQVVRGVTLRVMKRMGIRGLRYDEPGYDQPYAILPDGRRWAPPYWWSQWPRQDPYDGMRR